MRSWGQRSASGEHPELGMRRRHLAQRLAQGGELRPDRDHRVAPVPPDQIHVDQRGHVLEGHRRMLHVMGASPESLLFAARNQEQERARRSGVRLAKRLGELQQSCQAGGVVVGAVVDAVACPGPNSRPRPRVPTRRRTPLGALNPGPRVRRRDWAPGRASGCGVRAGSKRGVVRPCPSGPWPTEGRRSRFHSP